MRARSRLRILALIPVVVVTGLFARRLPGLVGDAAGGILYATLIYLVIAIFAPRARVRTVLATTAGVAVLIELAQLTGIPELLAGRWPPARLVLGSTFAPLDLVWAVAGAAAGALTDAVAVRRAR